SGINSGQGALSIGNSGQCLGSLSAVFGNVGVLSYTVARYFTHVAMSARGCRFAGRWPSATMAAFNARPNTFGWLSRAIACELTCRDSRKVVSCCCFVGWEQTSMRELYP